jgi:hypothetical protein
MRATRSSCPVCAVEAANANDLIDDLMVFWLFVRCSGEMSTLAGRCWSIRSATALQAGATLLRNLGSGIYRGLHGDQC